MRRQSVTRYPAADGTEAIEPQSFGLVRKRHAQIRYLLYMSLKRTTGRPLLPLSSSPSPDRTLMHRGRDQPDRHSSLIPPEQPYQPRLDLVVPILVVLAGLFMLMEKRYRATGEVKGDAVRFDILPAETSEAEAFRKPRCPHVVPPARRSDE